MARKKTKDIFGSGKFAANVEDIDAVSNSVSHFFEYATEVNKNRAVPDIRDGLISVQRYALFAMHDLNMNTSNLKGSAEVVGSAMRFHPHADSSLYDSMKRIAQEDRHPIPLISFQGNQGSLSEDGAALRYTMMKPSEGGMYMLGHTSSNSSRSEIDYGGVPMQENYIGSYMEAVVLPAAFPNYLINGHNHGIGVGIKTDIPKHNPKEVLDLAAHILKLGSANIRTSTLMKLLPGPDFPLALENESGIGCTIIDTPDNGIESYLTTGYGSFIRQASYHVEQYNLNRKEKGNVIIIDALPYGVSQESVVEEFNSMIEKKMLPESISLLQSKRLEFDIHKYEPEDVLPYLFMTGLRKRYTASMWANTGTGKQEMVSAVDAVVHWLNHRKNVVRAVARTKVENLSKDKRNIELNLLAIKHAKWLTEVSVNSKDPAPIVAEKLEISVEQAQSLLDKTTFSRLNETRKQELNEKIEDLNEKIAFNKNLISDEEELKNELLRQISDVKKKFGYKRRCPILSHEEDAYSVAPKEPMVMEPPKKGYLAIGERNNIRWAFRDTISRELNDDYFTRVVETNDSESLFAISNFGYVYRLPMDEAPKNPTGINLHMINTGFQLDQGEDILTIYTEREFSGSYIAMLTDTGRIKVVDTDLFLDMRFGGKPALTIDASKENHVVNACLFLENEELGVLTSTGKFSIIPMTEEFFKPKGANARASSFVKIAARKGGNIIWFGKVPADCDSMLFQQGEFFGRFPIYEEHIAERLNKVGVEATSITNISWARPIDSTVDTLAVASSDFDNIAYAPISSIPEDEDLSMKVKDMLKIQGSEEIYATPYMIRMESQEKSAENEEEEETEE